MAMRCTATAMCAPAVLARLHGGLAAVHALRDEWASSEEEAREALRLAEAEEDLHAVAVHRIAIGRALRQRGDVQGSHASLRSAGLGAQSLGYTHVLGASLSRWKRPRHAYLPIAEDY